MYKNPDILWLSTNPYLMRFNLPVIKYLSQYVSIGQWEYKLTEDETTSLDLAIEFLNNYLEMVKKPVHLVGHSTCGLLGLQYANKYPEKVKSLTLLGVGINPALDWISYYYLLRNHFKCNQEAILTHLAKYLFGYRNFYYQKSLVKILKKALIYSLSPHSLYRKCDYFSVEKTAYPLMVSGSNDDQVVFWSEIEKWKSYLKPEDYIWQCPNGEHFFHYFQPKLLGDQILNFWSSLEHSVNYKLAIKNY
ncbi:alpha/beta fold hydrolase [Cyanobacterium sp. Dongsha4]|uniref:alpha/beta fold hydrolase n=1 Tax=Cyanobacterium sp. DS4 TaxID=2878255 RepID=UPI002E7FCE8C|nr:alpha/beta fold hydrolase [Cyanobacterium sp. Dongsha4]WVL01695.1 alpha/beta hydrolase [Cyanobacterium sp. Dongsha4]